jgi:Trk K+ transport system NAD-binding subunit
MVPQAGKGGDRSMGQQTSPPSRAGRARQTKAVGRRFRGAPSTPKIPATAPVRGSVSFWAKARYRFDNALSRGAWVVIGYLGLVTLAIVVLSAAIVAITHLAGFNGNSSPLGVLEAFWQMLLRAVDAGTFASDATWPTRILGLVVTLVGIFIAGSLIGLISSAVDQQVDALRRGRSNVLEHGHSLILGWSARVPTIVSELVVANESQKRAAIVVLADLDKTEMEETLRTAVGDLRTTRLVGRRGDPSRRSDLELVGADRARSVLVMSGAEGDAGAIKTSLAVLGLGLGDIPVIVEMESAEQADTLEAVTDGAIRTVNSDRVIAEVTAQAAHEQGLAEVFRDLLDFDGDEIYFAEFPELVGSTYAQAQQAFQDASVMGIAAEEGLLLNPPPDHVVESGDRIIALAEDDSKFVCTGVRAVPDVAVGDVPDPEPPQRILLVGWSPLARRVIRELDEFLAPGSRLTVVVDPTLADPADARADLGLANSTVEVQALSGGPEHLGEFLGDAGYEQGILLGYREGISPDDADARTLLTLMALRRRWPKGHPPNVRLVAEVVDQRNVHIAQMAGVDDFIVSDQLASLMLAQLSERVELREVFDELFDASGASIVLRPAARFSPSGPASFADVVAAGNHFAESVLGYRSAGDGRVVLNPEKSARVELGPQDQVIVVTTR